jgi:hypothetical protein
MKVTLESTNVVTILNCNGKKMSVRLWQGTTESDIPVYALIPRIVIDGGGAEPDEAQLRQFGELFREHATAHPHLQDGWDSPVDALWVK